MKSSTTSRHLRILWSRPMVEVEDRVSYELRFLTFTGYELSPDFSGLQTPLENAIDDEVEGYWLWLD